MRESLGYLQRTLQRIDIGHTNEAISELREVLYQILELLDLALPKEVEPD